MAVVFVSTRSEREYVFVSLRGADLDFVVDLPEDSEQSVKTSNTRRSRGTFGVIDNAMASIQVPVSEETVTAEDGTTSVVKSERYTTFAGTLDTGVYVVIPAVEVIEVQVLDEITEASD